MSNSKQHTLIDRLYEKTLEDKLDWVEAPNFGGKNKIYQITLARNTIRIEMKEDADTNKAVLSIYNGEGKLSEKFSDEDIEIPNSELKYWKRMSELFTLAERKALGSDEIINEVLNQLGS